MVFARLRYFPFVSCIFKDIAQANQLPKFLLVHSIRISALLLRTAQYAISCEDDKSNWPCFSCTITGWNLPGGTDTYYLSSRQAARDGENWPLGCQHCAHCWSIRRNRETCGGCRQNNGLREKHARSLRGESDPWTRGRRLCTVRSRQI